MEPQRARGRAALHSRLRALARTAAAALALALLLRVTSRSGDAGVPRPRRALAWLPVYSPWPYAKVLDCFAIGLQALPLEQMQCVAFTTV